MHAAETCSRLGCHDGRFLSRHHACQCELGPTSDTTPERGLDWRDGLDHLDALLDDCSQVGEDYQNFVRVSAVRDIVAAVRRYEDDTDESIRSALWEDAVASGEPWAMGDNA